MKTETQTASSLWDLRMLDGAKPMRIRSYYPDVGRGNIAHDAVSHDAAERGIGRLAKKGLLERLMGWLDV